MATPIVKKGRVVLLSSDLCPRCGPDKGHLISDHDESKARQCSKCACTTQDVHGDPRSSLF